MKSSLLLLFAFIYTNEAYIPEAGIALGISTGIYGLKWSYCRFYECCNHYWIPTDVGSLEKHLKDNIFGQPYIDDIARLVISHAKAPNTNKPLVLSLHGPTGTGKNYLVQLITTQLFKAGVNSIYRKLFIATHQNYNLKPLKEYIGEFLEDIAETVSRCHLRSLIIIDEADKFPSEILDSLKSIMNVYENIDGVDYSQ
uniref:Torsin-like protein (Trinotate prediction) n=1 Tax=Henneguya salminicola TaxID=69463 RepID=A0A6G3MI67_HENSL